MIQQESRGAAATGRSCVSKAFERQVDDEDSCRLIVLKDKRFKQGS
jgi:hypothetical protein